jgi:hypothetical protein
MSQAAFPILGQPARHSAGGKVSIALPPGIVGHAVFGGPLDCYRYELGRRIADAANPRTAMFLWMNPSTAEVEWNDPTVAKGWRFTLRWGFQRMLVGNADAYRATDQAELARVADPMGPDNLEHLLAMARQSEIVVVGYGTPKVKAVRDHGPRAARALLDAGIKLHVLRLSKDGIPCHPLYLPENLVPVPWAGPPV